MTGKDNRIEKLLAATSLRIHPYRFNIVSIPISNLNLIKQRLNDLDAQFWSVSVEEDEVTMIVPTTTWVALSAYLSKAKVDEDYRIITLDVTTNWDIAGYLTKMTSVLTQEDITIGIISGFTRNHLIIKNKDLIKAIEILNRLIEGAQ